MCTYSMMIDTGRRTWPYYPYQSTTTPYVVTTTPNWPTPEQWEAFEELLEKAKKYDELTGQPDCEDPEKVRWLDTMRAYLLAVEERSEELTADQARYLADTVADVLDDLDGISECARIAAEHYAAADTR